MGRFFFGILVIGLVSVSFGQEKFQNTIENKEIDTNISDDNLQYSIPTFEITPSLSYLRQITPQNYQLMEINLDIDLRKKEHRNNTPLLQLPENKFVQSEYPNTLTVAPKTKSSSFQITGRGGYSNNIYSTRNRYSNSSTNNNGIQNNAYQDASLHTRFYNPFIGLPY
ncbi:hypothetical protein GCM10022393_14550 [Aquimarina addita]|uniref:Uncharacterized protein n=1 Tax=Aquimarina addita TaxID=870485 RepID=A0ABP7XGF0_9FLAO